MNRLRNVALWAAGLPLLVSVAACTGAADTPAAGPAGSAPERLLACAEAQRARTQRGLEMQRAAQPLHRPDPGVVETNVAAQGVGEAMRTLRLELTEASGQTTDEELRTGLTGYARVLATTEAAVRRSGRDGARILALLESSELVRAEQTVIRLCS